MAPDDTHTGEAQVETIGIVIGIVWVAGIVIGIVHSWNKPPKNEPLVRYNGHFKGWNGGEEG